jgi:hypothetical protein
MDANDYGNFNPIGGEALMVLLMASIVAHR